MFLLKPGGSKKYNKLDVENLKAAKLDVEGVLKANVFETSNGDIGYHFELNKETDKFEEGEIVGVVGNSNGKCGAIQKLDFQNCRDAMAKGVITRSQYFEAHVPQDSK